MRIHGLLVMILLMAWPTTAHANLDGSEFDRKIEAEISARDAEAGAWFHDANGIRANDPAKASDLYAKVTERVPDFDHALRRRCGCEHQLHHDAAAIGLCRSALALHRSAENLGALASTLIGRDPKDVTGGEKAEALSLSDEAGRISNDPIIHGMRAQIALAAGDLDRLRAAVGQLMVLAPNDWETHSFAAILDSAEGRFDDADGHIARATALGAPPPMLDMVRRIRADAQRHIQPWRAPALWFGYVTGAWAVGLALLFVAGNLASRATLRVLRSRPESAVSPREASLRSIYRAIVWVAAAYYYVSLPLVSLTVIGAFGGLVLVCLLAGWLPIKLLLIAGIAAFATVWATIKSAFVRVEEKAIGTELGEREHPRLRALLAKVAKKIETREPDEVRLTIGTELAVTERAGSFKEARGRGKRTLLLGVALLDGMTVRELKALIAHEMGHFKNEDTAGGGLALAVRRTILLMAMGLARAGAAVPWNPAWWFVRMYHAFFLRISQGASRLQEVLADRWAILAYGSQPFARGLEHVIERSAYFESHVDRTIHEVKEAELGLSNLYTYEPKKPVSSKIVAEKTRELIEAKPSVYDSHPSPAERLATAEAFAAVGEPEEPGDDDPAWSLFEDRESVERAMTDAARALLVDQGIVIPAETEEQPLSASA